MAGHLARIGAAAVLAAGVVWVASSQLDGPWGPLPGGRFEGVDQPCAGVVWERFADAREVEIEVRPEQPRSVTTWAVVHGGTLHLPADFLVPWKRWPHQVLEDPRIRLRVAGEVFACRVERVEDPARIEALRSVAAAKYAIDPDGRAARVEVWWFRVVPRG